MLADQPAPCATSEISPTLHNSNAHLIAPGAAGAYLSFVRTIIENMGYVLIQLRFTRNADAHNQAILQIMAIRDDGTMTISDCARISHALSTAFETSESVARNYVLEVSSPGTARPLTRPCDFDDWAGHEAKLELIHDIDGRKRLRGVIEGFINDEIRIAVLLDDKAQLQTLGLQLTDIASAQLVENLDALKASLKEHKQKQT